MKKFLACFLSITLLLSCFGMTAVAEDLTEISIATWFMDPSFTEKEDLVYEMIKERFGITIKPLSMSWGDYHEKTSTWVATGDAPDIFTTDCMSSFDPALEKQVRSWVMDGMIHALPEDLSAYPNLQKRFETDAIVQATMIDGQYWCIPRYRGDPSGHSYAPNMAMLYRKDWAKELGFDTIETYDQLVAFLRAIKQKDPSIVPMSGDTFPQYVTNCLWFTFEPTTFGSWQYKDGELYRAFEEEHTYEAAVTIRELFNEGLIDPDLLISQGTALSQDNFCANKVAVFATQTFGNTDLLMKKLADNNPDKKLEDMIGVMSFMPNVNDGKSYCYDDARLFWGETYISANVSDEKFQKILAFLDFTSSDEWVDLFMHGIEGVDYRVENGEIVYLTEDGKRPDVLTKYPIFNGLNELTILFEGKKFAPLTMQNPYMVQLFNEHFEENLDRTPIPSTGLTYMISTESDEVYVNNALSYIELFMYSGSTADPKDDWDAMMQNLRDDGTEENTIAKVEAVREAGRIE